MTRTFGAKDKVKRKERSDKGKKHKTFRGKPTKGVQTKRFPKKIGNKEILKLWIWEYCPMSKEGYERWNIKTRQNIVPYVCPADRRLRIDVHVSEINNKEKFEKFVADNMWAGTFYVMGFSHGKNKHRVKPVKLAKIVVRETEQGKVGRMITNYRLYRYWFWEKNGK